MTSSSGNIASNLDLATRSIDLVSVLTEPSGHLVKASVELVKWLQRERLSEGELAFTMQMAQDLAVPNSHGTGVLRQLGAVASRLMGLQLVMPDALGRSMLADPRLQWVVSTVAAIFNFHDIPYAVEALMAVFLASTALPSHTNKDVYKKRLIPVVTKVVESISLHVVNVGGGLDTVPESLKLYEFDAELSRLPCLCRRYPQASITRHFR